MSVRLPIVVLLSCFLHLVALWFLASGASIEYGAAIYPKKAAVSSLVLIANSLEVKRLSVQTVSLVPETEAFIASQEKTAEIKDKDQDAIVSARKISNGNIPQDYFPMGRLTRRPFPLADIDLDDTALDEVAVEGSIELTILVDVDGSVVRVTASANRDNAREFADRIAARFQSVRFSPGEIDGKAVKAELQITVVSEPLSHPAEKS